MTDPRITDPRDPRFNDPRFNDPRFNDPRASDPRASDPRYVDPRYVDPARPLTTVPIPAPRHPPAGPINPIRGINNFFAWFFTCLAWILVGMFLYEMAVRVLRMFDIQLTPTMDLLRAFWRALFG